MSHALAQHQRFVADLKLDRRLDRRQIQSLDVLQRSGADLSALIRIEAETNPLLDFGDPAFDQSDRGVAGCGASNEQYRQYRLDSVPTPVSLFDDLAEQLSYRTCEPEITYACEAVIVSLSSDGYLRSPLNEVASTYRLVRRVAEEALRMIQSFEPAGVGARTLRECLLLQLTRQRREHSVAYKIVDQHLHRLAANQHDRIARALKKPLSAIRDAVDEIRRLYPRPCSGFGITVETLGAPEVNVSFDDTGQLQISSVTRGTPSFEVPPIYDQLLMDPAISEEDRMFIREKKQRITMLKADIARRESTVCAVARVIVARQRSFFASPDGRLVPLTRKDIAAKLGVNDSTVGRAVAGKTMRTPRGVYPMEHFFVAAVGMFDGSTVTSGEIDDRIRWIIAEEDPRRPHSDAIIARHLKQTGICITGRTVANRRDQLGIASSRSRRLRV